MLLCYADSMADHYIDVHVALPEIVLRFKESRLYDIGSECLNMEGNILKLLKHFRFGGKNVDPDSFFSVSGRFEGMKTWYEQTNIGMDNLENSTIPEMHLEVSTYLDDNRTLRQKASWPQRELPKASASPSSFFDPKDALWQEWTGSKKYSSCPRQKMGKFGLN
jgi:hypothetical protein